MDRLLKTLFDAVGVKDAMMSLRFVSLGIGQLVNYIDELSTSSVAGLCLCTV